MDSTNTTTSVGSGGAAQDGVNQDSEERCEARNQKRLDRVICSSAFVGMVLTFIMQQERNRKSQELLASAVAAQKRLWEAGARVQMAEELESVRKSYNKVMIFSAKSVADRVANRVVGKYVDGLDAPNKAMTVSKAINQIVEEEMEGLTTLLETKP